MALQNNALNCRYQPPDYGKKERKMPGETRLH
jgi:hypothetical protein